MLQQGILEEEKDEKKKTTVINFDHMKDSTTDFQGRPIKIKKLGEKSLQYQFPNETKCLNYNITNWKEVKPNSRSIDKILKGKHP